MSERSCANPANPRINRVGGQAVLEGVMMKSGENVALSVRSEDGSIKTETKKFVSTVKKHKGLNIPVVRGVINMFETFRLSYSILGRSAEMLGIDDAESDSKFDRWLRDKFGDKLMSFVMSIAMVLGVALALVLFSFLPTVIAKWIGFLVSGQDISALFSDGFFSGIWALFKFKLDLPMGERFVVGMIQGLIKIAIFIGYLLLVSLMKDIKRTFRYHGAEHKSIACYEAGDELTPENAAKHTRLHPRCGTSFIFVTLILTILVFSPLPLNNVFLRIGLQFLFLPLVIGLSYEFIMYAGKHRNALTKILSAPGLAMQHITTKEPSLDQLEVALTSLKAAMPDEFPEFAAELAAKLAEAKAGKVPEGADIATVEPAPGEADAEGEAVAKAEAAAEVEADAEAGSEAKSEGGSVAGGEAEADAESGEPSDGAGE